VFGLLLLIEPGSYPSCSSLVTTLFVLVWASRVISCLLFSLFCFQSGVLTRCCSSCLFLCHACH